jgi:hypothetical protein
MQLHCKGRWVWGRGDLQIDKKYGHIQCNSYGFLKQEGIKCTATDIGFQKFSVNSVTGITEVD